MFVEMKNPAKLKLIQWNEPDKGLHTVEFTDILVSENTVRLKVSELDLNKIMNHTGLWVLKVHMIVESRAITAEQWITVGIFSSWKAAKQRLTEMIDKGERVVNDSDGKAWDIKRWDLEN